METPVTLREREAHLRTIDKLETELHRLSWQVVSEVRHGYTLDRIKKTADAANNVHLRIHETIQAWNARKAELAQS